MPASVPLKFIMYTEELWNEWEKIESANYHVTKRGRKEYLKKGYLHLDQRFWFPEKKNEIKELVANHLLFKSSVTGIDQFYSFNPFIKILTKTPRYRYQFEEGHYDLETKIRPICLTSHKDSLILGFYSHGLTKKYEQYINENKFDDVVLAYRTDLSLCNIQFAKEVFDIVKERRHCTAIALDIKGYFDHIDHVLLLEKWKTVWGGRLPEDQKRLYDVLTEFTYINQSSLLKKYKGKKQRNSRMPLALIDIIPGRDIKAKFKQLNTDNLLVKNNKPNVNTKRKAGIPQGSPISALLSNIYLVDFDKELKQKSVDEGFKYRRYCDDLLIVCDHEKALDLMNWVVDKIKNDYHLTIQPSKAEMIDFQYNTSGKIRSFRRPKKRITKNGKREDGYASEPALITSSNEAKLLKPLQYLGFEYNGKNILIRSSSLSRFFWKLNNRLQRTVIMAYSPKSVSNQIFLKQIYQRYSHIGTRNFLSYAFKSAKDFYEEGGVFKKGMNSPAIRKQVKNHFELLRAQLAEKNLKWFTYKLKKSKKKIALKHF